MTYHLSTICTFIRFSALFLTLSLLFTVSFFGKNHPYKRKVKTSLKNQLFNEKEKTSNFSSIFKEVEIKLRVFIPSPAVKYGLGKYMYGGDDRIYEYSKGNSRFNMTANVTTDPDQNPLLSKNTDSKVKTTRYLNADGQHIKDKPDWWWTVSDNVKNLECKPDSRKECIEQNVPNTTEVTSGNGVVKISFKLPSIGNPFPNILGVPFPAPDGKFNIFIQQCGNEILYRYNLWHNSFPAYELYINQQRVYEYMPKDNNDPLGMTGIFDKRSDSNWKKLGKPSENARSNPEATCEPATLFLFDTSGSMQENNKIEQARASALSSLNTIKSKVNKGGITPPMSIVSFSGACSPSSARTLLPFTDNLAQVENTIRDGIPSPGGETPLPQAKQAASEMLSKYLENNPVPDGQVILLSDGQSTCDSVRPNGIYYKSLIKPSNTTKKLSSLKSNSRIRYLTIGFDVPPGSPAERDLQYLASISNGKYFNAPDKRQLTRVFEKFVQTFIPKIVTPKSENDMKWFSEFSDGVQMLESKNYVAARQKFQKVISISPDNSAAIFNLAQALEGSDHYKGAVAHYQLYLKSNPQAADKVFVEQKILTLNQDYKDQFEYYLKIIESDLTYLKKYYQDLFNKNNNELAAEFAGFVTEKGEFYTTLQDVLEIQDREIKNHSKDLSDGLYDLSDRIDSPSFDRDAVSLLTLPISEIEEILELLNKNKSKLVIIQ